MSQQSAVRIVPASVEPSRTRLFARRSPGGLTRGIAGAAVCGVFASLAAVFAGVPTHAAFQSSGAARASLPPRPETQRETPLTPEQLKAALDRLGTVDYAAEPRLPGPFAERRQPRSFPR